MKSDADETEIAEDAVNLYTSLQSVSEFGELSDETIATVMEDFIERELR